jgi:hypothetical protein
MRQLRPVVLDDVVLVEVPAAVATVEAVREVEHAGAGVLPVGLVAAVGLAAIAPDVVLDVVGDVPRRIG